MYIPQHFAEDDTATLHEFIRTYPFATLVTPTSGGLNAEHIPMYLNTADQTRICLQGHIATSNSLWQSTNHSADALVIFQGIDSYITPSWLPEKKIQGKVVPTWNYTAVHVRGTLEFIHTEKWKLDLLHNLTNSQERIQPKPWSLADAPIDYIKKLIPAIVGVEIVISKIVGKFKLSQNQSKENRNAIADALATDGHVMADMINRE